MVKGLISLLRTWQYVCSILKPQDLDEPQRWIHSGWGLTIALQEEPYVCTYTVQWWQCSHNYVCTYMSVKGLGPGPFFQPTLGPGAGVECLCLASIGIPFFCCCCFSLRKTVSCALSTAAFIRTSLISATKWGLVSVLLFWYQVVGPAVNSQ